MNQVFRQDSSGEHTPSTLGNRVENYTMVVYHLRAVIFEDQQHGIFTKARGISMDQMFLVGLNDEFAFEVDETMPGRRPNDSKSVLKDAGTIIYQRDCYIAS